MSDAPAKPIPNDWRRRRRVIHAVLIYCAGAVAYLVIFGTDTALHQQIGLALIGLAATTVGSYVFGATWDDHNVRKTG